MFIFHTLVSELAQAVVDAGAVPLLVLCIQEPELSLKRISASALSDICKHSPELAQTVVDAGAIAHLAQMILNPDAKLKRQVGAISFKIMVLGGWKVFPTLPPIPPSANTRRN